MFEIPFGHHILILKPESLSGWPLTLEFKYVFTLSCGHHRQEAPWGQGQRAFIFTHLECLWPGAGGV